MHPHFFSIRAPKYQNGHAFNDLSGYDDPMNIGGFAMIRPKEVRFEMVDGPAVVPGEVVEHHKPRRIQKGTYTPEV